MEAGLDVLLEKPMVMNAAEAEHLIAIQQRTGRLLVVAFQGSLSPQVRAEMRIAYANDHTKGCAMLDLQLRKAYEYLKAQRAADGAGR